MVDRLDYGTSKIVMGDLRQTLVDFNTEFYNAAKRLWKDAAKKFIDSAVSSIVIDTGMSAASMLPLAEKADYETELYAEIVGKVQRVRRKGLTHIDGSYDASRYREIKEGVKAEEKKSKLLVGSEKRPFMQFYFTITVYQYARWEKRRWHSLEKASDEFIKYIDENWEYYFPKGLNKVLNPYRR